MIKKKTIKSLKEPVFKIIVREVVREELVPIENRLSSVENKLDGVEKVLFELVKNMGEFQHQILSEFSKFRNETFNHIDTSAGIIKTYNEEQSVHSGQHEEVYQDIQKLKQIHPNNLHIPVVA